MKSGRSKREPTPSTASLFSGVIADDLTGAAELAGVALRYQLSAEVHSGANGPFDAAVVLLDTDSREVSATEAGRRVTQAAQYLRTRHAAWFYKKVDSVLRGSVLAELHAARLTLRCRRVLLVPTNPTLGRVIKRGCYYVGGHLIHKTSFRHDPKHPCVSSRVLAMLGTGRSEILSLRRPDQSLPERGIIIGAASTKEDLLAWASRLDETTLPAGAAEFFAAVLETKGYRACTCPPLPPPMLPGKSRTLFVCGSAAEATRNFLHRCGRLGLPVFFLPAQLQSAANPADGLIRQWAADAARAFEPHARVVLAINNPLLADPLAARRLCDQLVAAAQAVLKQVPVSDLCVEGGATAAALLHSMGWTRLAVIRELSPGVVTMRPAATASVKVTLKPGSYAWPDELWV